MQHTAALNREGEKERTKSKSALNNRHVALSHSMIFRYGQSLGVKFRLAFLASKVAFSWPSVDRFDQFGTLTYGNTFDRLQVETLIHQVS